MGDEVFEFAKEIGATDLKAKLDYSKFHGLFKRRDYFLLKNQCQILNKE